MLQDNHGKGILLERLSNSISLPIMRLEAQKGDSIVEFTTETKDFKVPKFRCQTCAYRGSPLNRQPCNGCIFYKNYPKYKEDVRMTTSKLEEYTVSKYPEFGDSK